MATLFHLYFFRHNKNCFQSILAQHLTDISNKYFFNVLFTLFGTFFGTLQISFNHGQFTGNLSFYHIDICIYGVCVYYILLIFVHNFTIVIVHRIYTKNIENALNFMSIYLTIIWLVLTIGLMKFTVYDLVSFLFY